MCTPVCFYVYIDFFTAVLTTIPRRHNKKLKNNKEELKMFSCTLKDRHIWQWDSACHLVANQLLIK